jgi:ABC-2 type transport system permease protein
VNACELRAAARLDLGEALRSRWLLIHLVLYALLGTGFVWVGLRESNVLGFTGMGRVLFSLSHALVLVLPLLALLATSQVINRAREDGALELLLSQPIGRGAYLGGITLVRFALLALPFTAVMVLLALASVLWLGRAVPWFFLARALTVCAALLAAYVGLGIGISVLVRSSARALGSALGLWVASAVLLDLVGLAALLQWRVPAPLVFALAAINPIQSARLALLSAAEPTLGALGPVGFYLANQLGSPALLVLGIVWPVTLGVAAWAFALRSFRRGDAV